MSTFSLQLLFHVQLSTLLLQLLFEPDFKKAFRRVLMRHYQHIMQGSVERPQGQDAEKGTCLDTITVQLLNEGVCYTLAWHFVM